MSAKDLNPPLSSPLPSSITKPTTTIATASACPAANSTSVPAQKSSTSSLSHSAYVSSSKPSSKQPTLLTNNSFASTPLARPSHSSSSSISSNLSLRKSIRDPSFHQKPIVTHSLKQPPSASHIPPTQHTPDSVSLTKDKKISAPILSAISRPNTPSTDSDHSNRSSSMPLEFSPAPTLATITNRSRLQFNSMRQSSSIDRSSAYASDSQISSNNLDDQSTSENDDDDHHNDDSSESSGNEDLKFATSRNENVVLELSIDGLIRHISSNWKDIVGTSSDNLLNQPVSTIVVGDDNDKDVFLRATEVMKTDDSSYRVRFITRTPNRISRQSSATHLGDTDQSYFSPVPFPTDIGRSSGNSSFSDLRLSAAIPRARNSSVAASPTSTSHIEGFNTRESQLSRKWTNSETPDGLDSPSAEDGLLEMEGQGVLIYDNITGQPSHTMWILRPYIPPKQLSVDLPYELVHTLGFGVNILVSFLEDLSAAVIEERDSVPSPLTELCRICERHVPTWWFERHSELCLVEHKTQSELDSAHENLIDQRNTIIHLLALLDSRTTFGQLPELQSASSVLNPPPSLLSSSSISSIYSQTSSNSSVSSSPKLEYRGIPLPLASQSPASETSSPPRSPRMGSTVPSVSKRMLVKSFNLPKRSPIKLMELLIELCDLAVDINSPEIRSHHSPEGRIHSPQSESRIHRILNWVSPNVDDPALSLLCEDTVKYARQKVEAAVRLGDTITYFETIRHECESMVAAVIEDTIEKATLQRENNEFDNITQDDEGESRDYDNVGDDTDIDDNNSLFSESYLQSDALPLASRVPSSLRHEHSFGSDIGDPKGSRSVTPRSLLADSLSFPNSTRVRSDGSRFDSSPVTMDQSESLDFRLTDLDLNPRLQKKKSISNLSTYSSSSAGWTSLQRNRIHPPTEISQSPSTPLSSPLIFPHENAYPDSMNHRRQSSVNSDFSRAPVSPLLTSTVFPPKPAAASIKDYEIISPISKGAFGSVYLAKKRNTGEYFAIKVLKKADMIAKNQVKNVRAERAIMMSQSESPFVAKLYFTFQSKNYLYLVMEYLNGGDCAALVKVLGGLPEDWAKKYIAEVILGVEDLHKKGIIHRDLKPDNLLINQDGHLKLTDFGLSRMGLVGRHTHQPSIIEGSDGGSGSGSGSGSIIIQPKPQGKSNSSQETARPGSTSNVTTPGWANPLMESSISLVPGYFSYSKPSDRKPTLTRTESSNSTRGEALFNGPIFSGATKSATPDEEAVSSGSSDAGTGFFNAPIKSIPLFDPGDTSRKFVGTPDYLAPETIRGDGQDEMSDWWSTGCILFEFLYGYPPFHAKTPELVFENILKRNLQWPEADGAETPIISEDARDLIERLLCVDQEKRLGYEGGADEIKAHPFFQGINWDTLWSEEASFIPIVEDPESTDYFDSRGAESQALPEDIVPLEDTNEKSDDSDDGSYSGRSSRADSLDSVGPVGSTGGRKAAKLPLHIPPHVRENRTRRPSETVADDFGSFSFKNLPMLDKANKDTLTRIKTENLEHRNSCDSGKRGRGLSISASSAFKRPESPSVGTARHPSPIRGSSQTSVRSSSSLSPIITNASTISATSSGPPSSSSSVSSPHRKVLPPVKPRASMALTNMSTSPLSIECPKPAKFISSGFSASSPNQASNSFTSSTDLYLPLPVSSSKNQGSWPPQGLGFRRLSNMESSPELGEQFRKQSNTFKYPKVFDPSPSNSDSEEAKNSPSLFNRRPTARKSSSFSFLSPAYRPLIVLVCENNPVWRYSIETLLKGLGCRFITVNDPEEAIRYGTGDVKFDIIFTELKFHKSNGADVAKIIHSTSSPNTETPVVCVTNYAPEAAKMTKSHFSAIIPKPLTSDKLCDILSQQCYWKPKEDKPYKRKDSQGSNRKKSTDEYDRQKSGTSSTSSRKN